MQTISHGKIILFLSFCLLKVQVTKKEELHNGDLCDCENCDICSGVPKRLLNKPHCMPVYKLAYRNPET